VVGVLFPPGGVITVRTIEKTIKKLDSKI